MAINSTYVLTAHTEYMYKNSRMHSIYTDFRIDRNTIALGKASLSVYQKQLSPTTHDSSDEQYESTRMHDGEVFCQTDTQYHTLSLCNGRVHVLSPHQLLRQYCTMFDELITDIKLSISPSLRLITLQT